MFKKKPDLTLARVWGCMVQFMVPEQRCGGKLAPKARSGLHLGVSAESKGLEVLDLMNNKVITTVEAIFYETLSMEMWKVEYGPASTTTPSTPPTDSSSVHPPLLAADDELDEDDADDVTPSPPPPVQGSLSAAGDEGRLGQRREAADDRGVVDVEEDRRDAVGRAPTAEKLSAEAPTAEKSSAEAPTSGEPSVEEMPTGEQIDDDSSSDVAEVVGAAGGDAGELSTGEQSDDGDVVEVAVEEAKPRRSSRSNISKPPEKLSYNACPPPTTDSTMLDDAQADIDMPELAPDVHADPGHHWDIANMTVKEALASWKGKAVKAAMDEEISLTAHGSSSTVRAPDYYNDGTDRICKLLKSLYGLKQSPLLWYSALDAVLTGADWKKSQVDEALYFKVGDDGVACWVLVYVDDLLAASSSTAMLKDMKELLEAAFELCEISPVDKYLGLEIVRDRQARKLWLHKQAYVDKLRRRFIDEDQTGRVPKTPVSVNA
ncbi:unnamed protein product [Closterium sp. Naga37s-1]|nr:unnamed protein product [Closterium sp. Naga37s-1]